MLPVAILAGGLATRLRPLTETIPKSMVSIAGQPFLAHQLDYLRDQGITHVVICLGYLGEQIEARFGDGRDRGIRIDYSFDGPTLLGTGGALKKALPLLGESFFVLYGDSWLPVDFASVQKAFHASAAPALMTVFHNQGNWDQSNVWFENGVIRAYEKKVKLPRMQHIDYGLSVLDSRVFDRVPGNQPCDLATLFTELVGEQRLAGCEVKERFYEIGSPAGLAELDTLLAGRIGSTPGL